MIFAEVAEAPPPRRPFVPKQSDERERAPRDMPPPRDIPPRDMPPRDMPPRELPPRPSVPAQKAEDDFFAEMAREAREEDERERQAATAQGMGWMEPCVVAHRCCVHVCISALCQSSTLLVVQIWVAQWPVPTRTTPWFRTPTTLFVNST